MLHKGKIVTKKKLFSYCLCWTWTLHINPAKQVFSFFFCHCQLNRLNSVLVHIFLPDDY